MRSEWTIFVFMLKKHTQKNIHTHTHTPSRQSSSVGGNSGTPIVLSTLIQCGSMFTFFTWVMVCNQKQYITNITVIELPHNIVLKWQKLLFATRSAEYKIYLKLRSYNNVFKSLTTVSHHIYRSNLWPNWPETRQSSCLVSKIYANWYGIEHSQRRWQHPQVGRTRIRCTKYTANQIFAN